MKTYNFKTVSIDLSCQWIQFLNMNRYNWVAFDLIKIYFEDDKMHGSAEMEFHLLGFGIRIYWVYDEKQAKKAAKKYNTILKGGCGKKWKK